MIGYPFIEELFTNILQKSKAVEGRFFLCPNLGREMNSDEMGQVIQDLFSAGPIPKKYPLVLMMPPVINGSYAFNKGEWEDWRITLFFLNTTYYKGDNQPKNNNPNTKTSTHTIPQDWHDMKRAATDFIRVLDKVQRLQSLVSGKVRLSQERAQQVEVKTQIGIDKASGVRLDFMISVFIGCELEDYELDDIADIEIPVDDSHPAHQL